MSKRYSFKGFTVVKKVFSPVNDDNIILVKENGESCWWIGFEGEWKEGGQPVYLAYNEEQKVKLFKLLVATKLEEYERKLEKQSNSFGSTRKQDDELLRRYLAGDKDVSYTKSQGLVVGGY